jgi:hypothetical protein
MSSTADRTRQERVLAVALEVFGRYGYRKTSMDEVALSANISRQGLICTLPARKRVMAALDAWPGRYVGSTLASDIANLIHDPVMQLGDMVGAASAAFDAQLALAIAAVMIGDDFQRLGVTPEEIAAALLTVGQGAKYLSSSLAESRAEFAARVTAAVRVVFAGFGARAKEAP